MSFHVPPAIVTVEDSSGRRSGVDASKPLTPVGMGTELQQMPSWVDQQNIGSDAPEDHGAQDPKTLWSVSLVSHTAQVYRVHVVGMIDDVEDFVFMGGPAPMSFTKTGGTPMMHFNVLVSAGVSHELTIYWDPTQPQGVVQITRRVSAGQLAPDLLTACRLGLITPDGTCQSLGAKAAAAAADMKRGNKKAARGVWQALLNELKAQDGQHVKEPAATILREEVEVLLKDSQISQSKVKKGR